MPLKLLCAADLHLGRHPSRTPSGLAGDLLSGARAWERLVAHARTERVDLVLLAGDVVDEANRSFEAWGPLDRGVAALAEAGIPVVAVSGNHDYETLPEIADEFGADNLHVIGRGGRWERWTLRDEDGAPRLHVDGWSFPRRQVGEEPTSAYTFEAPTDAPLVGLVHGDLGVPDSIYGPLRAEALRSLRPSAWILGHVHRPGLRPGGGAPILYPGSLQALDPGEEGPHGAWIVTGGPGQPWSFEQIPLSATHYAVLPVSVDGIEEPSGLNAHVRAAVKEHVAGLLDRGAENVQMAWCRLRLTGRTTLHGRIDVLLERLDDFQPDPRIQLVMDPRIQIETRPALDLQDLARGRDSTALLARLLLALDGAGEPDAGLLALVQTATAAVDRHRHFSDAGLPAAPAVSDPDELRHVLRRQAGRLLDRLVQRSEAS